MSDNDSDDIKIDDDGHIDRIYRARLCFSLSKSFKGDKVCINVSENLTRFEGRVIFEGDDISWEVNKLLGQEVSIDNFISKEDLTRGFHSVTVRIMEIIIFNYKNAIWRRKYPAYGGSGFFPVEKEWASEFIEAMRKIHPSGTYSYNVILTFEPQLIYSYADNKKHDWDAFHKFLNENYK